MQQITLTLDLTPENLQLLASLLANQPTEPAKKQNAPKSAAPVSAPVEPKTKPAEESALDDSGSPPPQESTKSVRKTDVRALALALSKAGKPDTLREIFAKFDADKLSDIAEADYPALMEALVQANG